MPTPTKCKTTCFVARGGQTIEDGKSRYPDMLRLELDKATAWRVVRELLQQLETVDFEGNEHLERSITLFGELTEEVEDLALFELTE